jgi:coenzyme F420-0:L-glutamate ligase/coenzyme F420-1:gamma-L-glutamate ligase
MLSLDILEVIKTRRSIRKYMPDEVSEESILSILDAARWAPSAHNAQPWRFIVITKHSLKRKLAEAMANEWNEDLSEDGVSPSLRKSLVEASIDRFVQAPMLIVACIVMDEVDRYPDRRRQELEHLMAVQSLAVAIQNVLLAAYSGGLGSCWFCAPLFCQAVVKKVLGMPSNAEPQAVITLGYPSEWPETPTRKPIEKIVFKDRWGVSF